MKLIINTVNLRIGGAFQRSVSFLKELKTWGKDEYHVFYNKDIGEQIDIKDFPCNFKFYYFDESPASLKHRKRIIRAFNKTFEAIRPNMVFSFVGPCYWRPKCPHLVGFGVPHIVYDDYDYVKKYSWKTKLEMIYKKYWTKKEADYFVVQTEDVRKRLADRINVDIERIFVVSNGFGQQYRDVKAYPRNNFNVKKLLMISTYRPSKNFDIIKKVVPLLQNDIYKYEFHITIKDEDYRKNFPGFNDSIINHGHVKAIDCPQLYNDCDAMFLPSHLECFSASYPEAMRMERPILTSDLSFAHTVCGNAALYFNNTNPQDIADKIKILFHNKDIYNTLIEKGKMQLDIFETSREQSERYIEICKYIIQRNGKV